MADAKESEQQGLNQPQRYKVAADVEVLGHAPGSVFEAYIPEEQEQTLLDSGVLAKAAKNAALKEEEPRLTAAARSAELEVVPETAAEAAALEPQPPIPDEGKEQ